MSTANRIAAFAAVALLAAVTRADVPATQHVSTAPAAVPSTTQPAVAPFELLDSGHIAVMAAINGKGPYRFVLDTGAPMTLINEKVAKLSGIMGPKFHRPFFAPLGNLGPQKVDSIDISGGHQDHMIAQVWNHPTVDLIAREEGPLEGIIGFPFFAKFRCVIDYRRRTIAMTPSPFQPVDTQERLQSSLTTRHGVPTIEPAVSLGLRVAKGDAAAPGVTVTAVLADGPAAAAGVKVDDRLLTLDGRWTESVDDVYKAAAAVDAAATGVAVTVSRGGTVSTIRVPVRHGI